MKKFILKFWPVLFIFATWFIFASPYFLRGLVTYSSTYQVNHFAPWDAYSKFAGPVKNGAMPDVTSQIYPWKHLVIELWRNGAVPLWNPYSFSGTPLLANYQSAVFSPFNLLFFLFSFINAWSILVLLQPLLAGFFTYLFVRSLKRSKTASLISGLSFMFCGFITVWMDYATLGYAILFLPLALFAVEQYHIKRQTRFLFLLSLSIPLSFFSGHFQISIYFFLGVTGYILFKLLITKDIREFLVLCLFTIFGLMVSMIQVLPSIEFYLQSLRSGAFRKDEVIPWFYLPTLIAPDFFGSPVTGNDWFGHYAEWNAYVGVIPLILAFYGILSKRNVRTFFFFILATISILLAFNTPVLGLMVASHMPVLSTSAASRIIVIFSFAFAVLASFGLDYLIDDIKKNMIRKIVILTMGFVFIFGILWIVIRLSKIITYDKISVASHNFVLPTILFMIFSLIVFLSVFLYRRFAKNRVILNVLVFLIVIITAFDMLRFAIKWQAFDPASLVFPQVDTTKAFSKIAGYDRVMGNFGAEVSVYYHLPSTEGYDPLNDSRYAQFIDALSDGKIEKPSSLVVAFPKYGIYTPQAINLLDIRYLAHKISDGRFSWAFPFWTYPNNQFKLIYENGQYEFYENTKAFPRAFLVSNYTVVNNPQKIINTMFGKNFDLRHNIVLEKNIGKLRTSKSPGDVRITDYTANRIKISVSAKSKSLLFLSEVYYPGWVALIDGRQTNIYRSDYVFRAIVIPAGIHKVEFVYNPLSFKLGVYSAFLGLLLIFSTMFCLIQKKEFILFPKT